MTPPPDAQRVRDTVVRAVGQRPGIGQAELASRVATATRASNASVVATIRELEREGVLASRRADRRKVYELPAASPLELARRAEIDRIAGEAPAAPARPVRESAPPAPAAEGDDAPPAATAPPPEPRPLAPPPPPARRPIPAWGWGLIGFVGLAWNLLIFRLLGGD